MSEIQKIAIGLLGMSHPEIYRHGTTPAEQAPSAVEPPALKAAHSPRPAPAASALRGLKFAFAALLAGSRSIPLGDNGRITRELGEYGAHLKGC
jgi:hypothetical protein